MANRTWTTKNQTNKMKTRITNQKLVEQYRNLGLTATEIAELLAIHKAEEELKQKVKEELEKELLRIRSSKGDFQSTKAMRAAEVIQKYQNTINELNRRKAYEKQT